MRQALDYCAKLAKFFPPDAPAWDDASNNKWLVSGRGALIMNPPSAWAVAKRDAPQVAEQCWTHGMPSGPKGRFAPFLPYFWAIWNFSKNKPAAKSLLARLSQPAAVEKLVAASGGYDLPSFEKLTTLKTWAEEGPPKGTLYHYPNPHNHQILSIAAAPAPPKIALQIYTQGDPDQDDRRAICRARRWKRRSPGPRARSKASCGPDPFEVTQATGAQRCAPAAITSRGDKAGGAVRRNLPVRQ